MFVSAHVLKSLARSIRQERRARCCSLFLPAVGGSGDGDAPLLLHDGEGPPVPELESLVAALELHRDAVERARASSEGLGIVAPTVLRSVAADGCLVALPSLEDLLDAPPAQAGATPPARRSSDGDASGLHAGPRGWIGLRGLELPFGGGAPGSAELAPTLFGAAVSLAWQARELSSMLGDPVTGLPERTVLQAVLQQELRRSRSDARPLSLLLVSPRDLSAINDHFGRPAGDAVLREVGSRLWTFFRRSDLVSRYGAAVFAVLLTGTDADAARAVTEKLLRFMRGAPYTRELGDGRPRFAAGIASFLPEARDVGHPHELLQRADLALCAARQSPGDECVSWSPDLSDRVESSDRLSGIFTAELSRDYRNMVLLWDTIHAVASHSELGDLVDDVIRRLFETLLPDELGLFLLGEGNELTLFRALEASPGVGGTAREVAELPLSETERRLVERACRDRRPSGQTARRRSVPWRLHAIPLLAQGRPLGSLYLAGDEERFALDPLNVSFVEALAGQLAVAMDRARTREREDKELRSELEALRKAIGDTKIVHVSESMRRVLRQVRRVAPSDVTVLILGESGTGKELVARSLHEASRRSGGPFVVIDCGAVAPSLLEAELFGHERGAFTGAEERKRGRLADAAGGTVLLDEIGELPVDLQVKLLRFVQEKELVPVGGSRPRLVDARILAATHRDLAEEVHAGRFRADLYYRLNVIHVEVPPLRERPDDVVLLATHFVRVYSRRYDRELLGLTRAAEQALVAHSWPGNVRELQNKIIKAVLLCDGERIGPEELELSPAAIEAAPAQGPPPPASSGSTSHEARSDATAASRAWARLRGALSDEVEGALASGGGVTTPVAARLESALVRRALDASGGVVSAAASALGVPESTLRRKSGKRADDGARSSSWADVERAVADVLGLPRHSDDNLLQRARELALEVVTSRAPRLPVAKRAALMGVTPQTLRRWTRDRRQVAAEKTAASLRRHHFHSPRRR